MSQKKFFIIDAMAMIFRNHYAFSYKPLTTSDGFPTSALYGTLAFMLRLLEKEKPDYLLIASDSKEPTFRHRLYDQYKANRTEMPEDLAQQMPYIFDALGFMGCKVLKEPGVEADDIIAGLAQKFASDHMHCYIVSGDKDLMQLVNDNVTIYSPKKGGEVTLYDEAEVLKKFDCKPEQIRDLLALTGDSSDNIPGVPGIGLKGAAKLLETYGHLDKILANADKIKNKRQANALLNGKELALISRELVTLKTDLSIVEKIELAEFDLIKALTNKKLEEYCNRFEFKSLANRIVVNRKQFDREDPKPKKEQVIKTEGTSSETTVGLIQSKEAFADFVEKIRMQEVFAFDTETTGLDKIEDYPIGISFSFHDQSSFYIPLVQESLDDLKVEEVLTFLKKLLSSPTQRKIAHNLKFDKQMLANLGVQVGAPYDDTMLMSFIIDSTRSHSLDNLSLSYLGIEKIKLKDLLAKHKTKKMQEVDLQSLSEYAGEDSLCCLRLYEKFQKELTSEGLLQLYEDLEKPFLSVLSTMEAKGVLIDVKALKDFSVVLEKQLLDLQKEIYELAEEEFNINSPKQMQHILYEKLKIHESLNIRNLKKTKTGFSTDVSVLQKMSHHPLIKCILEFRTITKLKNTYVDVLPEEVSEKTGRVHTSFHQTGTETGRLSSSNPNLQNIPIRNPLGSKVRAAFIAKPDYEIISADYSQVELRIMAHFAREETLQKAFLAKKDIHRTTAAVVFSVAEDKVTDEQRSQAKAINFGILYGMGARKLAQSTGFTLAEAKDFIDSYFARFPKVKAFITKLEEEAEKNGYTTTLTGRRRLLPGLKSDSVREQVAARNMAINTPIQGSAADLIKVAMINLHKKLKTSKLRCVMLLQIHDELVFECHKDDMQEAQNLIKAEMEGAWKLFVPIEVSIGAGKNWLEAHA